MKPEHDSTAPPRLLAASLTAVALLAAGCDVRDEAVRPAAAPVPWPLAVLDSASRFGDSRAGAVPPTDIEFVEGFEAASRRAATGRLPMMLVFRASWCRWSSEVAQGPLADRALVGLSRRFACVSLDADRDADICRSFAVTGFPTVIVLDADGREHFRATGASAAGGLAVAMNDVLGNPTRPPRLAAGQAAPGANSEAAPTATTPAAQAPPASDPPDNEPDAVR